MGAMAAMAGGQALGGLAQGYFGYQAAQDQMAASKDALQQQILEASKQRNFSIQMGQRAEDAITGGLGQSTNALGTSQNQQLAALQQANRDARAQLGNGAAQLNAALSTGQDQYEQTMGAGNTLAQQQLTSGNQQALQTLGGAQNRLADLYSNGVDMSRDPGMAFRQQQGEDAIMRAAAAQGGRMSGNTLSELVKYNSNLASQEYGNAFQRQLSAGSGADQSEWAKLSNIAGLQNQLGGQLSGLTMGNAQALANNQYATQSAMGNNMSQYMGNLANLYMNQGQQQAGIYGNTGNNLASLYSQAANAIAGGYTGTAAQNAQLTAAMLPQYQVPTQYAGGGMAALGNAFGQGLSGLGFLGLYGLGGGFGGGGGGGWSDTGQPGVQSRTTGYGGYSY